MSFACAPLPTATAKLENKSRCKQQNRKGGVRPRLFCERHGMALIVREHMETGKLSSACYSPCEIYRYTLTREWDDTGRKLLFIMLNPSTATEERNDPTIERCERRAVALGYGAFRVCNLFAFRATDPKDLKRAKAPIGPDNLGQLLQAARWADDILCA